MPPNYARRVYACDTPEQSFQTEKKKIVTCIPRVFLNSILNFSRKFFERRRFDKGKIQSRDTLRTECRRYVKKKRGGEASATFEILSTRGTAYEPSARVVAVQSIVNGFTKVKRSALKSGESFFRLVEDMTCEFICEKSTKSYFIHYVLVRLLRSRSSND